MVRGEFTERVDDLSVDTLRAREHIAFAAHEREILGKTDQLGAALRRFRDELCRRFQVCGQVIRRADLDHSYTDASTLALDGLGTHSEAVALR